MATDHLETLGWEMVSVGGVTVSDGATAAVTGGTLVFDGTDAGKKDVTFNADASEKAALSLGETKDFTFDVVYDDTATAAAEDLTLTYTVTRRGRQQRRRYDHRRKRRDDR